FNKMIEKQRKTEISLKQSEKILSQIARDWENTFDAIESPVALINNKGEILRCNKAQKELLGIGFTEIIGFSMHKLIHNGMRHDGCLLLKAKKSLKRESRNFKRDNSWFQCIVDPILDDSGEFIGAVHLLHDITERIEADAEYKKLSIAVEQSANAVLITDIDGKIEYVNPKFTELTGFKAKEVIGENPKILSSGFHPGQYFKELWETISSGRIWEGEFYNKKKNGELYWEQATITPVKDDNGKIINYIAIKEDITERKIAEKKIEKNQYYLTKAQEIGTIGTWELDIKKNILTWTDENYKIFGIPLGTKINYEFFINCIHPDDRDYVNKKWSAALKKESYDIEHRFIVNDEVRWVREKADIEFDSKDKPVMAIGFTQDITERKLVDDALLDSKNKLIEAQKMANLGHYILDLESNNWTSSAELDDVLGIEENYKKDFAGWLQIVHPDDRKTMLNYFQDNVLVQHQKFDKEYRIMIKRSGEVKWVHGLGDLKFDKDNKPVEMFGTIQDISKSKIAEEALKDSEEKYRTLSSNLPGIVYRVHLSGEKNFEILNDSLEELTGYKIQELKSGGICSIDPLIIDEDREFVINKVKESVKQKKIFEIEYRIKHKDGSIRNFLERGNPVYDRKGKPLYIDGLILDNTIQKGAIEELKKQQDFFKIAINALTHPFYIIDINTHKVILMNNASEKFIESENQYCYSITHNRRSPCDDKTHPCPIEKIKKTKKPVTVEHVHTDDSGKKVIHEVHGFPIMNENGDLIQLIEYCIDITERKESEKQALKQQEEFIRADKLISLGILVSGVAHEINNPNNSILLNSQFLAKVWQDIIPILDRTVEDDPSLRIGGIKYERLKQKTPELFSGISESSARIREIVEDLKRFSRKDLPEKRSQVDVNSVVKSAVNLMSGYIKKSTNNFILKPGNNLPLIWANFQKIEQVLINLIQNSCQAVTSVSDEILISTKFNPKEGEIVITVKDEGVGIKKNDLKYITEPFFTTKREIGGTGLGLSVSEKIINDHKGKLLFSSEPGSGTIVEIFIPSFKSGPAFGGEKSE
ncbi:MAG: PAS domain S-box protein, partial [Candidatus Aminicenantes bacterium]|nr:PAS domain S-box protein [Candidatus Aminicenantes bacterium]